MGLSIWQVALVVVLFLLLFGKGRVPQLMSDLAEGIKGFRKGLSDDGAQVGQHNTEASPASRDGTPPAV